MYRSILSAAVLAAAAGSASAQTLMPQFFVQGHAPPSGWTDHRFVQTLGVETRGVTAAAAATALRNTIQAAVQAGTVPSDKIAVYLHGFGHWKGNESPTPYEPVDVSLFHPDDEIYPAVDWMTGPGHGSEWMDYAQPWMTNGITDAKAWMEAFLDAYTHPSLTYLPCPTCDPEPLPTPIRFHCDTEVHVVTPFGPDQMRPMEGIAKDERWDDGDYLVPGTGKTMQELYDDAILLYGWDDEPLEDALFDGRDDGPEDAANRKYWLWFDRVCRDAIDAAMKEVAYDVIQSHDWAGTDPLPLVSNYNFSNLDGKENTFGWSPRDDDPNYGQVDWVPEKTWINAWPSPTNTGRYHFMKDLEPAANEYSIWLLYTGKTSGDFSSPRLYHHPDIDHRGPQYYLPGWPTEGRPETSLRMHRHAIESILASDNEAYGPDTIAPWILINGGRIPLSWPSECSPNYSDRQTDEETRMTLAMFRAKNLHEMIVFNWDCYVPSSCGSCTPVTSWSDFKDVVDQVYTPRLQWYYVSEGTGTQTPAVSALQYTLNDPGYDTVIVETSSYDTTSIVTYFDNLDPQLGNILRLNLELSVEADSATNIQGIAEVWRPSISDWVEVNYTPGMTNQFHFNAPKHDGKFEARASLWMPDTYVEEDWLSIRITVWSDQEFITHFDLTQVYWANETGSSSSLMGPSGRGADVNYDGVVDEDDLAKFSELYLNSSPAADFNFDGVVDPSDLAAFLAAYGQ